MSFQETINSKGHILYWIPDTKYQYNSEKILGMDLDWTIIKPIHGKIHPRDENDWEFFTDKLTRIKTAIDNGYKFIIFTNQAGLLSEKKNQLTLEGFKIRWDNIYARLQREFGISSVWLLASLYDDFNRKPCTGMWEFVEKHLNGDMKVDRNKSLYVGDMAGRKADYSSSDLLFAMNSGVEFQVPEVFYNDSKDPVNKTKKLIDQVNKDDKIFKGSKLLEDYETGSKKHVTKDNANKLGEIRKMLREEEKQYLVIVIGSPASGKSSYYTRNLKSVLGKKHIYLSMDKFNGTPAKFAKEVDKQLKDNKTVIIDNTNGTVKTREKLISLAIQNNIPVIGIHFTTPKDIVKHLNALRTKITNVQVLNNNVDEGHSVPAVAIHSYWKHLEEPNTASEHMLKVFKIDYEPVFHESDKRECIRKEDFIMLI